MAAGTAMGKIGKIDFFACLPSGTYAFLCLYLSLSIVIGLEVGSESVVNDGNVVVSIKKCNLEETVVSVKIADCEEGDKPKGKASDYVNNTTYIWEAITKLIKKTSLEPTSLLLIIFFSYLLGSIFRAIPVSYAEFLFNFKNSGFPDQEKIKIQIQNVGLNHEISQVDVGRLPSAVKLEELVPSGESDQLLTIYNYWKDVLCINSPEGFAYYQEFEARTRFFSGMVCSGLFGITIVFIALLFQMGHQSDWEYLSFFLCGIFIALIMFMIIFMIISRSYLRDKDKDKDKESQSKLKELFLGIYYILIATTGIILWVACVKSWGGSIDLLFLFILSNIIVFIFGFNLLMVRLQEAQVLTGLYLAYRQRNHEPKSGVWKAIFGKKRNIQLRSEK